MMMKQKVRETTSRFGFDSALCAVLLVLEAEFIVMTDAYVSCICLKDLHVLRFERFSNDTKPICLSSVVCNVREQASETVRGQ